MRRFPWLFLAASAVGCGSVELPVLSTDDAAAPDGATTLPPGGGTRADFCAGSGPPSFADRDGGVVCSGGIAQKTFRYALCTCEGLVTDHQLTTDAFDGSQGPYDPAHAKIGGSIGSNGNINASAAFDIGGSVWAGDVTGLTTNAALTARGELHAAGKLNTGPALIVGTDAWLAGGIVTSGDVLVPGTLFVPNGVQVSIGGTKTIGATVTAPVSVPAPCDCDPSAQLDVASFVDGYRTKNDDAAEGIDPATLENVSAPLSRTLRCGRYFFTRVGAHAKVDLTASGRVAIFIGGDFAADADFVVDVPAGSELDLFIAGNVVAAGTFTIGDPANPARARTYVGGIGTVNLQSASQLAGNLYAPRAQLVLGGSAPATVFGSIFAKRVSSSASLTIHFDESVAKKGDECPNPTSCKSCHDCGNQACHAGQCGACSDSSECCAPYVCRSGTCVLDIR